MAIKGKTCSRHTYYQAKCKRKESFEEAINHSSLLFQWEKKDRDEHSTLKKGTFNRADFINRMIDSIFVAEIS